MNSEQEKRHAVDNLLSNRHSALFLVITVLLLGALASWFSLRAMMACGILLMVALLLLCLKEVWRVIRFLLLLYLLVLTLSCVSCLGLYIDYKSRNEHAYDLHSAAQKGDIDTMLKMLRKVEVNAAYDEQGNTLLHVAAQQGNIEVAQLLLTYGADVEMRNGKDKTPLQLAQQHRRRKLSKLLAEHIKNQRN